ncbi:MAG: hypothetical protein GEU75_13815 [Dehalococcoidia bacterium]|nr:hypothetical protein [Dehalococcoidia bacterium]
MLLLYRQVGQLSPEQLEFLVANLEEEWSYDRDYYINRDMYAALEAKGAEPALLQLLGEALGDRDEVDILWMDTEAQNDDMYRDLDEANWDHEHTYGPAGELLHPDGSPAHAVPNPDRPTEWTNPVANRDLPPKTEG